MVSIEYLWHLGEEGLPGERGDDAQVRRLNLFSNFKCNIFFQPGPIGL